MIFLPISYALLIAAADLLRFFPVEQIYTHILPGIVIGAAAPILTIGLLPIFESLFHITTDITLLELSDPNRTLLRQLAIRAPGTYTHSLIMANLSESAAEAITANPLLARVGCYYHDIGKVSKPEYFSENQGLQGGRNPHDNLMPYLSMLIIASHVREGLELAEEHGLPQSICDLISQHHGTTVIEYFYERAVELGDRSVREEDFRYNGPKPQTKEAGILMLADSVEAAARHPRRAHAQSDAAASTQNYPAEIHRWRTRRVRSDPAGFAQNRGQLHPRADGRPTKPDGIPLAEVQSHMEHRLNRSLHIVQDEGPRSPTCRCDL